MSNTDTLSRTSSRIDTLIILGCAVLFCALCACGIHLLHANVNAVASKDAIHQISATASGVK